jgi:hypothetical protein
MGVKRIIPFFKAFFAARRAAKSLRIARHWPPVRTSIRAFPSAAISGAMRAPSASVGSRGWRSLRRSVVPDRGSSSSPRAASSASQRPLQLQEVQMIQGVPGQTLR